MSSVSQVLDVYLLYSVSFLISTYVDRAINLMKSNVQCLLESILLSQVCFHSNIRVCFVAAQLLVVLVSRICFCCLVNTHKNKRVGHNYITAFAVKAYNEFRQPHIRGRKAVKLESSHDVED